MSHEAELYDLLQGIKQAEEMDDNEEDSTVGTTHLYPEPEDREDAQQSNSPWGEAGTTRNGQPQPDHQSDGVWKEHQVVRQGVLDNVFSGRARADAADQKLIAKNFKHGKSGDFTTHSVHLQGKSVEKISHARTPTLMEQVRRSTGMI